jgi:hypothetical protein
MMDFLLFLLRCGFASLSLSAPGGLAALVHAWLGRVADLPGWRAPYDLLPGERLSRFT